MLISPAKAHEAAEALNVGLDSLTTSTLNRAFRAKAKLCHPDYHGTKKLYLWARISWAKECLIRWLEQNPTTEERPGFKPGDCRACGGSGRVTVGKSFGRPLTMMCVLCRGQGTVEPEEIDLDD
jgi:DnaJ-class molecular chaperone